MASFVFIGLILFSLWLAVRSRKGSGAQSMHDFCIASGQFGAYLVFFLTAGEIYSIGTMVGFPGGIYGKGPTYGIWYLGYILLAYPIGYFIGPRIWAAGRRYNAITLPDLFKGYYRSRTLEVVVATTAILFLLPWGQMQFTGLVASLKGLGWDVEPLYLILVAALLAFTYIAISGVRASAYIAILKDTLMVVAIVVAGAAVIWEAGVGHVFAEASRHVSNHMTHRELTFSMSTMLFQSMGFYVMPFLTQSFFTAKSPDTIRRTQVIMPLYLLMYPFLVLIAYYALTQKLHMGSPNEAFFAVVVRLLPDWLIGLVAAAASLSGLLVLAGICLAIGPMVTRNLLPDLPERKQKRGAKIVIGFYLAASIVMTLLTPKLMLTLNNVAYYGITQFFPGALIVLLGWKVRPLAVAMGILTGQALVIALYVQQVELGGVNLGLVCLVANAAVTMALNKMVGYEGLRTRVDRSA